MKTNKKEFDAMNTTNNNQIGDFKMTTNNNTKIPFWNPNSNRTEIIDMLDRVDSEFKHKNKYNIHNNKDFIEFLNSVNITVTDIMSVGRSNYRKILCMKYFVTMLDRIRNEHK